jgi:hypothetical protein
VPDHNRLAIRIVANAQARFDPVGRSYAIGFGSSNVKPDCQ